ncbi:MAG: hypothetical protein Q8O04_09940 [Deltaproteobacteria bacterium]|nr:hypothetical protein [Deltaproteobacteria bacterium]
MRYLTVYWRGYYKVRFVILILIQFIGISFYAHAYAFRDVSIPVWSELADETELILNKEKLSDFIEVASDDEVLKVLEESEKEIEKCKQDLAKAEKENKSEKELADLRKKTEEAEGKLRNSLSRYDKEIKVVLKAGYPGPVYLGKDNYLKDNTECKDAPLFYFEAEGGIKQEIRICELEDLGKDIKAKLIVKDKQIEVIKEGGKYKLNFGKAKDPVVEYKGELRGKADFKFGISPQVGNPITFLKTQSPAGKPFKIRIPVDKIDKDKDHLHVYFMKDSELTFSPLLSVGEKQKPEDTSYIFKAIVPDSLSGDVNVAAVIINNDGKIKGYNNSIFRVRSQNCGIFYGIIITFSVIFLISLLCKGGWKTWWRAPLDFTVSPLHRYSISLLQILIWTTITIFSLIYVYYLQGEFLLLTNQILILLGISGATALSAKAAAVVRFKELPDKYYKKNGKDLRDCKRKPKFSDYVSIGGIPNLFKFQILGFTVITGIIVVWELIKTSNFPEIPSELLILMGISGGAYVGNEIATENVWTKLEEKVKKADEKYKEAQERKEREKIVTKYEDELSKITDKEIIKVKQELITQEKEKIVKLGTEDDYKNLHGEIYEEMKKIYVD